MSSIRVWQRIFRDAICQLEFCAIRRRVHWLGMEEPGRLGKGLVVARRTIEIGIDLRWNWRTILNVWQLRIAIQCLFNTSRNFNFWHGRWFAGWEFGITESAWFDLSWKLNGRRGGESFSGITLMDWGGCFCMRACTFCVGYRFCKVYCESRLKTLCHQRVLNRNSLWIH